ncbi:MAG: Holliday junction resolvase RuvX [Micrococcales bacterium]|nr:MAG: Holliday junction resolvase RuvX [Micrococcales bacterium]
MRHGVRVAVDVGAVRVGVAASDPGGILASAVATLSSEQPAHGETAESGSATADVRRIAGIVRERDAIEVLVGLPLSLSGKSGAAAELARSYAVRVAREIAPVPVRLVDERLTTVGAHRALRQSGVKGRNQRRVVDQVAAVLILQGALDTERNTGQPPGEVVAYPPTPPAD